jgi:DNA-binding response OmpR family regulator
MAMILIVDDEEPLRDFLTLVFEDAGYEVRTAIHGVQALEIVAQDLPDLVISDVMMPLLNGVELCRQLKQANDIPVILMSAAGHDLAKSAGADAFIAKPFELESMESLVNRVLSAEC